MSSPESENVQQIRVHLASISAGFQHTDRAEDLKEQQRAVEKIQSLSRADKAMLHHRLVQGHRSEQPEFRTTEGDKNFFKHHVSSIFDLLTKKVIQKNPALISELIDFDNNHDHVLQDHMSFLEVIDRLDSFEIQKLYAFALAKSSLKVFLENPDPDKKIQALFDLWSVAEKYISAITDKIESTLREELANYDKKLDQEFSNGPIFDLAAKAGVYCFSGEYNRKQIQNIIREILKLKDESRSKDLERSNDKPDFVP